MSPCFVQKPKNERVIKMSVALKISSPRRNDVRSWKRHSVKHRIRKMSRIESWVFLYIMGSGQTHFWTIQTHWKSRAIDIYLSEYFNAAVWKLLQMGTTFLRSISFISTFSKNLLATISRASSGQGWNQSIVQQLINEGNFLKLLVNCEPIGLIQSKMCRFSLHRLTKKLNKARGENSAFLSAACAIADALTS